MSTWLPSEDELIAIVAMTNAHNWAEGMERTYRLSVVENPEVLVLRGGVSRDRIVWVEVSDNVSGMHWGGYVASTGHVADDIAEVMQISDHI